MITKKTYKFIYIIFIISVFIFSCNTDIENISVNNTDTLIITDTIKLFQISQSENYTRNRDNYLKKYEKAYNLIKDTPFNDDFFSEIRGQGVYVSLFVTGMVYDEQIIYNSVIIFYLKYYQAFLNGEKYSFKLNSDIGENSFMPIFFLTFINLSNKSPEDGVFPNYVYEWVLTNPTYFNNEDIAKEIEKIKIKLKEK